MGNMIVVFIGNAIHAILAAMCAIDTDLAILDMDISRRILVIGPFGSRQANMTFRAIFTNDTFNGYAIFAISAFDRNAIFTIDTHARLTISTIDANVAIDAIFTVFATNIQVICQFQIIRNFTIFIFLGQLQIATCV